MERSKGNKTPLAPFEARKISILLYLGPGSHVMHTGHVMNTFHNNYAFQRAYCHRLPMLCIQLCTIVSLGFNALSDAIGYRWAYSIVVNVLWTQSCSSCWLHDCRHIGNTGRHMAGRVVDKSLQNS